MKIVAIALLGIFGMIGLGGCHTNEKSCGGKYFKVTAKCECHECVCHDNGGCGDSCVCVEGNSCGVEGCTCSK